MRILWHNAIVHPIAGVLWLLGFDELGDRVHDGNLGVRMPGPEVERGRT